MVLHWPEEGGGRQGVGRRGEGAGKALAGGGRGAGKVASVGWVQPWQLGARLGRCPRTGDRGSCSSALRLHQLAERHEGLKLLGAGYTYRRGERCTGGPPGSQGPSAGLAACGGRVGEQQDSQHEESAKHAQGRTLRLPLASQLHAHVHAPYSRGCLSGERRGAVGGRAGRVVGQPSLAGDAAARGMVRMQGLRENACCSGWVQAAGPCTSHHPSPRIVCNYALVLCICPVPAYVYGVPASRLGRKQVSPVAQPPPSRRRRPGLMVQVGAVTQLPP